MTVRLEEENFVLMFETTFSKCLFSHNIMLWVSFSDSRDGIDLNGWISSFQTPPKRRKLLLLS